MQAEWSCCRFRMPRRGARAIWQVTNSCNYACRYCIFSSAPQKVAGELSTEEALRVIDELAAAGFGHLKVTGGEPLLRADLIEILRRAGGRGISWDLSTNGSLLKEETAEALRECGRGMLHLSLDGPSAAINDSIRGANTFFRTLRAVQLAVKAGLKTRIGSVVFSGNESFLDEMVTLCAKLGVNEVVFSRMEPLGRLAGSTAFQTSFSNQELAEKINAIRPKNGAKIRVTHNFSAPMHDQQEGLEYVHRCPAGRTFIYIDNLGRVSPCTWLSGRDSSLISARTLKEVSLATILNEFWKTTSGFASLEGCPVR
jgi:MoaA/NifB/PqqE/SkfB family radical SAM enzyme